IRGRTHDCNLLGSPAHGGPPRASAQHADPSAYRCPGRQAGEGAEGNTAAGILTSRTRTAVRELHVPPLFFDRGPREYTAPLAHERLDHRGIRGNGGGG